MVAPSTNQRHTATTAGKVGGAYNGGRRSSFRRTNGRNLDAGRWAGADEMEVLRIEPGPGRDGLLSGTYPGIS